MTKKAYVLRLFSIVTPGGNHVKIAGFLTLAQKHIFQKKFTKNSLEKQFLAQVFSGQRSAGRTCLEQT